MASRRTLLFVFVFVLAGAMLFLAIPAGGAPALQQAVTPRPSVQAPPKPTATVAAASDNSGANSPPGAYLALQINFAADWPWYGFSWQSLWTEVEWSSPDGLWHPVDGWRGTLDTVVVDPDSGLVTGWRYWWVSKHDLGGGPFRWVVRDAEGGAVLGMSDDFYLPAEINGRVVVPVNLTP